MDGSPTFSLAGAGVTPDVDVTDATTSCNPIAIRLAWVSRWWLAWWTKRETALPNAPSDGGLAAIRDSATNAIEGGEPGAVNGSWNASYTR